MKLFKIKYIIALAFVALTMTSCEDFLDRPNEDSYNAGNYYKTDEQCIAGVNYLYNSPWYDYQRGFFKVGEGLSGNLYMGNSPYCEFTLNGTDQDLVNMAYSLWAVIGHSSTVYNYINASSGPSQAVKDQTMGECLVWKAMAYFYLVRSFGEVPIVHNNTEELEGAYNTKEKVWRSDVYEYIIMTLEKARELLAGIKTPTNGRVDYYSATGLLAKVYWMKAGISGTINGDDMAMAAQYAKEVIDNSGRTLMENYEDIFRGHNNNCSESLIAWRWTADGNVWTAQNSLESDLGMTGFEGYSATWGDWTCPSVDLQEAFGIKLLENNPDMWLNNVDTRLKATMMLPGFTYSYFWRDHEIDSTTHEMGFDYLKFMFDTKYNKSAGGQLNSGTGSNCVKHLYGNTADHVAEFGHSDDRMASSLSTHLLRLADIYLIYAEAKMGTAKSTSDASAIDAFYAVRHRAIRNAQRPSVITFDDIWKERRLELAFEGDRWFDYVRVSYFDPDFCVAELRAQKRSTFYGLSDIYKTYAETGIWSITASAGYNDAQSAPNPEAMMKTSPDGSKRYFFMPFPQEDVVFNPNLGSNVDGVHVDVRATYSY